MRVTVQFMGPLKDFVGKKTAPFDLPDGAAYGAFSMKSDAGSGTAFQRRSGTRRRLLQGRHPDHGNRYGTWTIGQPF